MYVVFVVLTVYLDGARECLSINKRATKRPRRTIVKMPSRWQRDVFIMFQSRHLFTTDTKFVVFFRLKYRPFRFRLVYVLLLQMNILFSVMHSIHWMKESIRLAQAWMDDSSPVCTNLAEWTEPSIRFSQSDHAPLGRSTNATCMHSFMHPAIHLGMEKTNQFHNS